MTVLGRCILCTNALIDMSTFLSKIILGKTNIKEKSLLGTKLSIKGIMTVLKIKRNMVILYLITIITITSNYRI